MPDWIHSIVYIIIVAMGAFLGGYYTQNILGIFAGIGLAHFVVSAVIKRIPGFWGS